MNEHIDPCEGCKYCNCTASDYRNKCMKCKRLYADDTNTHTIHDDLYEKED